jgi:hypothetical protein
METILNVNNKIDKFQQKLDKFKVDNEIQNLEIKRLILEENVKLKREIKQIKALKENKKRKNTNVNNNSVKKQKKDIWTEFDLYEN